MYRRFDTAMEASSVLNEIRGQLREINYNRDLRKLLQNCDRLISVLGSVEVQARQGNKPSLVEKPRNELANAIDYLEKLIIIAKLTQ